MYVQPKFISVNVLNIQITTSKNIPSHRREVFVSGDGNYFYRDVARWKDELNDENARKSLSQIIACLRKSQDFCAATFLLELIGGEEADYWKSSRNCGHIFACASLLKRPIGTCTSSESKKGFSFGAIINAVSFSSTTAKRQCMCLITSMHRDNI